MLRSVYMTTRTRPGLWETVKREVMRSPKGGPAGKWSARKAQRAVSIYKSRGGGYVGKKSPKNSLVRWTNQKWDYISGKKYGRYLPLEVRKHLTSREKRIENRRKSKRFGERVPYSKSVAKKVSRVTRSTSRKSKRRSKRKSTSRRR
jgi:hypothetical protein